MRRRVAPASSGHVMALVVAVLLVLIVNALAGRWLTGVRIDLTRDGLNSFSEGTRAVLASLDEPIRIDLYASTESIMDIPDLRAHAIRVEEYVRELADRSNGQINLRVIHPAMFSAADDDARSAGLLVQPVNNAGGTLILGLVATGSTGLTKTVPFFAPDRDSFVEYDITKAVATVGRQSKPRVGLLSSMPLDDAAVRNLDGSTVVNSRPRFVVEQMRDLFDLREVSTDASALPTDIDALLIVQPRNLPDPLLRSIDAWALAGKPIVALVDPFAETDSHPDARQMEMKVPATAHDFPLLRAWGIRVPTDLAVGDVQYATPIRTPGPAGTMRELSYLAWLSLTRDAIEASDPVFAQIENLNVKSCGYIERAADAPDGVHPMIEPLLASSERAQLIQTLKLGWFGEAEQLLRDSKADGVQRVLAARITGRIGSAFGPTLGEGNIVVIADADLLSDDVWVQMDQQSGVRRAFADNGPLIIGLLEQMAGDPAIATLRSRGAFSRPFARVEALRTAAQERYIAREKDLQLEVRKVEIEIAQLQGAGGGEESGELLLSPQQRARLAQLQQTVQEYRKELRGVQFGLRNDVESLGVRLLMINVIAWPAIVAIAAGMWCWIAARRIDRTQVVEPSG